jgi:hypothetical protein
MALVDDCPMTDDCPGYDRDQMVCLIHPGDCEFSPADREVGGIEAGRFEPAVNYHPPMTARPAQAVSAGS